MCQEQPHFFFHMVFGCSVANMLNSPRFAVLCKELAYYSFLLFIKKKKKKKKVRKITASGLVAQLI